MTRKSQGLWREERLCDFGQIEMVFGGMQCRANNKYWNSPYTNIEFGRD